VAKSGRSNSLQGSLWAVSYDSAEPNDNSIRSTLNEEAPNGAESRAGADDGAVIGRSPIPEPVRQGGIAPREISAQGNGTAPAVEAVGIHLAAENESLLGQLDSSAASGDDLDGSAGSSLSFDSIAGGEGLDQAQSIQSVRRLSSAERWFSDSKIVNEDGAPLLVYRDASVGSENADTALIFSSNRSDVSRRVLGAPDSDWPRMVSANLRILSPATLSDDDMEALVSPITRGAAVAKYSDSGFDGAMNESKTLITVFDISQVRVVDDYQLRNTRNFQLADDRAKEIGSGGDKSKIKLNLDALELLKSIEAAERIATPAEQSQLAGYVDFGGLRKMWDQSYNYRAENSRMYSILTPEEIDAIKETSINTHYTAMGVVDSVWKAAAHLGFDGGRVLEPGMGVGNFFGRIPQDLAAHSELMGVEKNIVSGRMAKLLYPDARITVKPYEDVRIPNNSVDLIIGNPPFAEIKIFDPDYANPKLSVHNYFIVKSLDKLKPGGIAALITTHYTLDSASNVARAEMAKRADLVAAIRLPNNAFAQNAGTQVTTDILFFRKRGVGEPEQSNHRWLDTVNVPVIERTETYGEGPGEEQTAAVNEYFVAHPEMVLGDHSLTGSQYRSDEYTLKPNGDIKVQLAAAIDSLPRNIARVVEITGVAKPILTNDELVFAPEHIKEGAFYLEGGKVWIKQGGQQKALPSTTSNADTFQLKSLIGLRDAVNETLRVQRDSGDDADLKGVQEVLGRRYDSYRANFGPLTGKSTRRIFEEDPEYPLLTALENIDPETEAISKADIFTKRTTRPYSPLRELPEDPKAAMLKVMAETGRLDIELMSSLLNQSEVSVIKSLLGADLIYQDPVTGTYMTSDEYLSGNVRLKLAEARSAAELDPLFERNVIGLEAVQPEPLSIVDIDARLGQTWIPNQFYARFIHEHLAGNVSGIGDLPTISRDGSGRWYVDLGSRFNDFALTHEWAGGNIAGHKLVEYALNQQQPSVYFPPDTDGKRQLDTANTAAARFKAEEIKDAFKAWIKGDKLATDHPKLEKLYNDAHNGVRLRVYDGAHLEFPGLSIDKTPRPYQGAVVWRVMQDGRALIDHFVGGGKTLEMIMAGMELRRTGLSNKNLYVVPNNMVPQWREDFKSAYPAARVLAVTDKDLSSAANRKRLFSRIATNEWDAVIVPHSQFNMLPISPERERITINRQKDELKEMLLESAHDKDASSRAKKRSTRDMQIRIQKFDERLKQLASGRKDNTIYFDDLGIDMLFIDEAHAFKALPFATKMGNIAGLSTRRSQRAQNLLAKIDYMYDTHNHRGVVFATGTAITNTLGEAYTMNRYIAPDLLESAGIRNFDDWAANYAEATTKHEYAVDGATIRPKTSLSTFVNVPELRQLWAQFADVVTQDAAVAAGYIKVPYAKREDVLVEVTPEQEPMLLEIAERGEKLMLPMSDPEHPDPTVDNWLKLDGDARDISLDARMRDSFAQDHPGSKINETVRVAKAVYDKTMEKKGTVVIFSDRYATSDGRFNIFTDIKAKLVAQGVPAAEIAIVHDYPKREQFAALQSAVRAGRVRFVLGTTEKLGVGVNIQERLKAEIHIDMPQRPDQLEQREGRIVRWGNIFDEVEIYRLITRPRDVNSPKAHDLQRAQLLERKQTFLTQFKVGGLMGRHMEDVAGDVRLSPELFALAKAQATGNPLAMEKIKLETEIRQIGLLDRSTQLTRHRNRQELTNLEMHLAHSVTMLPRMEHTLECFNQNEVRDEEGKLVSFKLEFDKERFTNLKDANEWLKANPRVTDDTHLVLNGAVVTVSLKNSTRFDLATGQHKHWTNVEYCFAGEWFDAPKADAGSVTTAHSLVTSLLIRSRDLSSRIEHTKSSIATTTDTIERLRLELLKESPYKDSLEKFTTRLGEVQKELLGNVKEENVIGDSSDESIEGPELPEARDVDDTDREAVGGEGKDEASPVVVLRFEEVADALLSGSGAAILPDREAADQLLDAVFREPSGRNLVSTMTDGLEPGEQRKEQIKDLFNLSVTGRADKQASYAIAALPGKAQEVATILRGLGDKEKGIAPVRRTKTVRTLEPALAR
jgi:N12 class adenine-specific DNA methylase